MGRLGVLAFGVFLLLFRHNCFNLGRKLLVGFHRRLERVGVRHALDVVLLRELGSQLGAARARSAVEADLDGFEVVGGDELLAELLDVGHRTLDVVEAHLLLLQLGYVAGLEALVEENHLQVSTRPGEGLDAVDGDVFRDAEAQRLGHGRGDVGEGRLRLVHSYDVWLLGRLGLHLKDHFRQIRHVDRRRDDLALSEVPHGLAHPRVLEHAEEPFVRVLAAAVQYAGGDHAGFDLSWFFAVDDESFQGTDRFVFWRTASTGVERLVELEFGGAGFVPRHER
mmetsp:Transcript_7370/g.13767  ORF Transcript_7370/g.13767 Transcript_7370/m.13767 type:complete len:281 (+) Transcript_7370:1168-2010(+)